MFCRSPSRPTRSDDDEITGAGRPLRNTLVAPAGLTPEEARLRHSALPAAAHAHPSRSVPIRCEPRRQPAWTAVDPSTPTTHLDPP